MRLRSRGFGPNIYSRPNPKDHVGFRRSCDFENTVSFLEKLDPRSGLVTSIAPAEDP